MPAVAQSVPLRITFAASEGVPFSKTGGLADVVGALPRALARRGHQVSIFLPKYRQTHLPDSAKVVIDSLTIPFAGQHRFPRVIAADPNSDNKAGVRYYFIDYDPFFDRDALYNTALGDYGDNLERFTLFSRAVLEASKLLGVPDVFHAHDWQTALIPLMLRTIYYDDHALAPAASVFTIHNMGYQGIFPGALMPEIVLPQWIYAPDRLEHFGAMNLLKGGIIYGDHVTTVSPTYMREIRTPEFGFGLDGVVRWKGDKATGILNGVDYDVWDPAHDGHIAAHYSPDDLAGKAACKSALLRAMALPEHRRTNERIPLIGIVSRFAVQKGFDLIAAIAERLAREPMQLVVLGSGDRTYEDLFRSLAAKYPEKIAVKIGYDNPLAHQIEAGSDLFLMPSHYEPCGLNQIYSLKYGTPPIVRATGGLDDTVENWDDQQHTGTGFKFWAHTPQALLDTLRWALRCFDDEPAWRQLMLNGMCQDFSWDRSAAQYESVYTTVRGERRFWVGR